MSSDVVKITKRNYIITNKIEVFMKKLSVLILSVLLLGNISTFSQPGKGEPRGKRIKADLKLTPEQEKKFDDFKYLHQQSVIDIHAKIQKNRLELKKMIDDGKIDEKKILQLTDDNSKLQGNIKFSATKLWLDVYKMLNDEQKAIWTKHLSKMTDPGVMKGRIKAGAHKFMPERGMRKMNGQKPGMH
jgi:Spy/CpxP family protein refolding chaperone